MSWLYDYCSFMMKGTSDANIDPCIGNKYFVSGKRGFTIVLNTYVWIA